MSFEIGIGMFDDIPLNTEMEIIATVSKEIVNIPHTGFGVYIGDNISLKYGGEFKFTGSFPIKIQVGRTYKFTGRITAYQGERQLQVDKYLAIKPETKDGVKSFLKTIKGISKVKADQIYKAFGSDSVDILMNNPERVIAEIPKVGQKTALKWQNELKQSIEVNGILVNLMDFGLTMKEAQKLYKIFKDDVVSKIEENPYILIEHARGFGFEKCDRIARKIKMSPTSPFRLQEGILHTLRQESLRGHCFLPIKELLEKSKATLDIKLTFDEMSKFMAEESDNEHFIYEIGSEVRYLSYKKLASYYNSYKNEEYKSRKDLHRYPVIEFGLGEIELEVNELIFGQNRLIMDEEKIYLKDLFDAEVTLAKKIVELPVGSEIFPENIVRECLQNIITEDGIELEGMQEKACIDSNVQSGGLFILNGSAGTGKTFTLNLILKTAKLIRERLGRPKPNILAFAPTGKASKVASKSIRMHCATIHKGLGFNPEGGFLYNESNPFKADIIVCDETSMIDLKMAKNFLLAIKRGAKVIFMGDTKQLASVGAGNVLKDIIESGVVPVVTLNVIKRQGLDSNIILNANRIISKQIIENPKEGEPRDSFFLSQETDKGCRKTLIESVYRIMKNIKIDFEEIQILSPQRTGSLGVYAINHLMQKEFNPYNPDRHKVTIPAIKFKVNIDKNEEEELTLSFRAGDKVINTRNNYDLEHYKKVAPNKFEIIKDETGITNGECGIIESIETVTILDDGEESSGIRMIVRFDDFYAIYIDEFSDLEHAYCLTIHKSQGSAWKAVIMPITRAHINMLDNNLIYTGWTRAREFAVAIGSRRALEAGVRKSNATKRYTSLSTRLRQCA